MCRIKFGPKSYLFLVHELNALPRPSVLVSSSVLLLQIAALQHDIDHIKLQTGISLPSFNRDDFFAQTLVRTVASICQNAENSYAQVHGPDT